MWRPNLSIIDMDSLNIDFDNFFGRTKFELFDDRDQSYNSNSFFKNDNN